MPPAQPTAELLAAIPGITARLALILGNLAALVARAFLRHPVHVAHIVPLWNYIRRTIRRVTRALNHLATGTPRARTPHPRTPHPGRTRGAMPPGAPRGFPTARAWLRASLAHEANAYGSQLAYLLDQPETRALLQSAPQVARLLRPICRYLGIQPEAIRLPPRQPVPGRPRPVMAKPARLPPAAPTAPAAGPAFSPRPLPSLCPRLLERWPFAPRFA